MLGEDLHAHPSTRRPMSPVVSQPIRWECNRSQKGSSPPRITKGTPNKNTSPVRHRTPSPQRFKSPDRGPRVRIVTYLDIFADGLVLSFNFAFLRWAKNFGPFLFSWSMLFLTVYFVINASIQYSSAQSHSLSGASVKWSTGWNSLQGIWRD